MEVKIQVLALEPIDERLNFQKNGKVQQRALQCFLDGKVAVHTVRVDVNEDNIKQLQELENMQAGYYMADLRPRAGNYGRLEFTVGTLKPAVEQPKAKAV